MAALYFEHWDISLAFVVLGLGAWVTVNGVYQELPIIAQTAPEGYDIFSYLAVVCALANFVPFAYLFIRNLEGKSNQYEKANKGENWDSSDTCVVIFTLGVVGVFDCIALAVLWDSKAIILGREHSVGFLVACFVGGSVDCLTSLLFYPFAAQFPSFATSYLLAGEALTGLLASAIVSIQMTTNDPEDKLRFSISVFFVLLGVIMGVSAVAFLYLVAQINRPGLRLEKEIESSQEQVEGDVCYSSLVSPPTSAQVPCHQPRNDDRFDEQIDDDSNPFAEDALNAPPSPPSGSSESVNSSETLLNDFSQESHHSRRHLWILTDSPVLFFQARQFGWLNSDPGHLFSLQAIISFLENGLLVTLLPRALGAYKNSDAIVSIAIRLSYAGATVISLLTQKFHPAPLFIYMSSTQSNHRLDVADRLTLINVRSLGIWILIILCMILPAIWVLVEARDYTLYGSDDDKKENGYFGVFVVVLFKWSITYAKTCLFLSYHPEKRVNATKQDRRYLRSNKKNRHEGGGKSIEEEQEEDKEVESNNVLRWGGTGIQVGGLFGAVTFFICTISYPSL